MTAIETAEAGLSAGQYSTSLGLIIAFRVLATCGVVTRLCLIKCRKIRFSPDDWLILLTSLLYWVQAVLEILRAALGKGDVSVSEQLSTYYKLSLADGVLFALVLAMARFEILLTILLKYVRPPKRFTGDTSTRAIQQSRRPYLVTIVWNGLWFIFTTLISLLQCLPESVRWTHGGDPDQCLSLVGVILGVTIWDLTCTMAVLCTACLALPKYRGVKYQRTTAAIVSILCIGVVVVEVARIALGAKLNRPATPHSDAAYSELAPLESSLVILVASSLPFLHPSSATSSASAVYTANPYRSPRDHMRALRDRILIGRDTYHPRYYPNYKRSSETAGLTEPGQVANPFGSGGAQVDSEPVLMVRSGWDPLPRYTELRHGASHTSNEIQVEQEVHVEMENMEPRLSATS